MKEPFVALMVIFFGSLATGCGSCDLIKLELQNLGVDFAAWDSVPGSTAGDFKFAGPNNMVELFGHDITPTKRAPSIDFYLDEDAELVAPVSGTISRVVFQSEDSDYEVEITAHGCQVFMDHVSTPQVSVGDEVTAGQVIATAGPWDSGNGIGLMELTVLDDPTTVCPTDYLAPSVADSIKASLAQLMTDVETYHGDTSIYDESAQTTTGCLTPSFVPPE